MKDKLEAIIENIAPSVRNDFLSHKDEIGDDILFALNSSFTSAAKGNQYSKDALEFINSVIDRVWEQLNVGNWKDVPECLRDVFAYASFLKAMILLKFTLQDDEQNLRQNLIDTLEAIDRGLLLGSSNRQELCQLASALCPFICDASQKFPCENFSQLELSKRPSITVPHLKPLPSKECPSIESFLVDHFKPRRPVKLTGCIKHWPALTKWDNVRYIYEKIGPRLVPVEIGSSYTSSNWSQKLMTVDAFIKNFFFSETEERIGYLAQHQLFNQIPELLDDICEPDYCVLSENYDDPVGTDVNAWFGPSNTVSPLHYDPKHNFLAQVVGKKRVFLIDPKWSENVYPYDDFLLFNTAQVDLENIDYEKFPKFENTEIFECILEAGEMLYIPPKWWHHIRAQSVSFSVSFWWGNC
ncbi:hypothetical protein V9T40_011329 [Parthenolecanium corni]|uniref:JmjC domain-containing protein n=1 Tax=Parthenolecanium corni TaxID=536013 RepID=A0AAN9XZE0_9HEMI